MGGARKGREGRKAKTHVGMAGRQNFRPWIHVTPADFDSLTRNRALCEADGTLSPESFESMMREQVGLDGTLLAHATLYHDFHNGGLREQKVPFPSWEGASENEQMICVGGVMIRS